MNISRRGFLKGTLAAVGSAVIAHPLFSALRHLGRTRPSTIQPFAGNYFAFVPPDQFRRLESELGAIMQGGVLRYEGVTFIPMSKERTILAASRVGKSHGYGKLRAGPP